jgi:EAL and modified HD-GYP domain-containing signal transduction protein
MRYVARQPIFDREEKVFGYELLFRDSLENCFVGDADEASRATLDRSLVMGLDVLCDGRRAFLNCTRDTLIKGLVGLLPSTTTVVEILETVPPDPDVMAACHSLKEQGYLIALDDYVADDRREPLTDMADIIKVDMLLTTQDERGRLIKQLGPWRCRMLAERVETQSQFEQARDQGFVYFQGYFFRRPEMMGTHDMPANRLNYIRMLQEVSRPELDVPSLEKLVKEEASVCYRLLRYLNSAVFGFKKEIHSVRHALSILGERDLRRWVRLIAAVGAGQDKTSDLVLAALVRGRFCELIAPKGGAWRIGFVSDGVAITDRRHVGGTDASCAGKNTTGRSDQRGAAGTAQRSRSYVSADAGHESGEWEAAAALSAGLRLDADDVAACYWQAQQWARELSVEI